MTTYINVDYGQLVPTSRTLDGTKPDECFEVTFPDNKDDSYIITIKPKPGYSVLDVANAIGCSDLDVGPKSRLDMKGERPIVMFCHPSTGLAYFCKRLLFVGPGYVDPENGVVGHFEASLANYESNECSPCYNGTTCLVKDGRCGITTDHTLRYDIIAAPNSAIVPGTADGMELRESRFASIVPASQVHQRLGIKPIDTVCRACGK